MLKKELYFLNMEQIVEAIAKIHYYKFAKMYQFTSFEISVVDENYLLILRDENRNRIEQKLINDFITPPTFKTYAMSDEEVLEHLKDYNDDWEYLVEKSDGNE